MFAEQSLNSFLRRASRLSSWSRVVTLSEPETTESMFAAYPLRIPIDVTREVDSTKYSRELRLRAIPSDQSGRWPASSASILLEVHVTEHSRFSKPLWAEVRAFGALAMSSQFGAPPSESSGICLQNASCMSGYCNRYSPFCRGVFGRFGTTA